MSQEHTTFFLFAAMSAAYGCVRATKGVSPEQAATDGATFARRVMHDTSEFMAQVIREERKL